MLNRRALFGLPLAAMPVPASAQAPIAAETDLMVDFASELRHHLTNVLGFSSLMTDESLPRELRDEYAERVYDGSAHLMACVDDFLDTVERRA